MEALINLFKDLAAWISNLLATVFDFVDGWNKHYDFETAE